MTRTLALGLCALVPLASAVRAQDAGVGVTVNGQQVTLSPAPVERAGRVFVPLRGVFEHLGATVVYANGQINATGNNRTISLQIGSTQATVDGQQSTLDVAPFIIGASTYVPLRFVAQALGASVNYDNNNRIVAIAMNAMNAPAPPPQTVTPPPPPAPPQRSPLRLARVRPDRDETVASNRPTILAEFTDAPADPNSVRIFLDGLDITGEATRSPSGVVYSPPSDLLPTRHTVMIRGRDSRGGPFEVGWSFVSGTETVQNFLRGLRPSNDGAQNSSFYVAGNTLPGSTVTIDAGAQVNLGGVVAFGGDHERIETIADPNGNFNQLIQLRAVSGEVVTLVVTSTEPRTRASVKETRHFPIR